VKRATANPSRPTDGKGLTHGSKAGQQGKRDLNGFLPSLWPNRHETNRVGVTEWPQRGLNETTVNDSIGARKIFAVDVRRAYQAPDRAESFVGPGRCQESPLRHQKGEKCDRAKANEAMDAITGFMPLSSPRRGPYSQGIRRQRVTLHDTTHNP
jgi:hypothetical protein